LPLASDAALGPGFCEAVVEGLGEAEGAEGTGEADVLDILLKLMVL
jgi:hypothetical protein